MATFLSLPEPARDRIIRITNAHFDANNKIIEDFFKGYKVQDQYRTINTRTGTHSIVYVLFNTVADKIRSCELSGSMLLNREIKIQPAPQGNYKLNDDETTFIKPIVTISKNTATMTVPNNNIPVFEDSDFPTLRSTQEQETPITLPATLAGSSEEAYKATVSTDAVLTKTLEALALNADEESMAKKRKTKKNKGKGKQAKKEDIEVNPEARVATSEDYETASTGTVTDASKGKAVPTEIETENGNASKDMKKDLGARKSITMTAPSSFKNWNLSGHNPYDRSKNVITPDDWYNFPAKMAAKLERERANAGTNSH